MVSTLDSRSRVLSRLEPSQDLTLLCSWSRHLASLDPCVNNSTAYILLTLKFVIDKVKNFSNWNSCQTIQGKIRLLICLNYHGFQHQSVLWKSDGKQLFSKIEFYKIIVQLATLKYWIEESNHQD